MENSMEVPLKTKSRTTIWPRNLTSGHIYGKNHNLKDTCTPVFIAALFIIAKTWKQPKCPLTEERMKEIWYIHTMEYYSAVKRNNAVCSNMYWPRDYHTKCRKPDRKRQISYNVAYMWNLKKKKDTNELIGYEGGKK